jgi:hypothetical protein
MSHVHVLTDDLLFGSRLQADLTAAGHVVTLGPTPDRAADAIVADLTHDSDARIAALTPPRPPTLAFFSHVEADVRARALAAGIERVVPRSRIAREGPALLAADPASTGTRPERTSRSASSPSIFASSGSACACSIPNLPKRPTHPPHAGGGGPGRTDSHARDG